MASSMSESWQVPWVEMVDKVAVRGRTVGVPRDSRVGPKDASVELLEDKPVASMPLVRSPRLAEKEVASVWWSVKGQEGFAFGKTPLPKGVWRVAVHVWGFDHTHC